MRFCEHCGAALKPGEEIVCDECVVAQCERLLSSKRWMEVRGPFVADEIRKDLAAAKGRIEARR
jgi:hypothetical protein